MGTSPKISGYELVGQVLAHPKGGVEALIRLAGDGECDWLEFKAGMSSRPQDRKTKENDTDAYWHVAEAVIALMNTRGGAVLIGVDDKTKTVVPLRDCDPRRIITTEGLEAYRRKEIGERIDPASGEWRTGLKGTWKLENGRLPLEHAEVIEGLYQNQGIAIIMVKPVIGECVRVWREDVEQILKRVSGQIGKVESIVGSKKMAEWVQHRQVESESLACLLKKFLTECTATTESEKIEKVIATYYEGLRKKCDEILTTFTPLDVEEQIADDLDTPVPSCAFEPDAEEWLRDDESEVDDDDLDDDSDADDLSEDEPVEQRPPRRGGVFTLLAEERRAVLLGEPGGGKTTCLKLMALNAAANYEKQHRVAIFIPLSRWGHGGSLLEMIAKVTGLSLGQFEQLMQENRCQLLLDALNECPDALRKTAVDDIRLTLRRYPEVPVVLSARTGADTQTLRFSTFTVRPLDRPQQERFLCAYLKDAVHAVRLLDRIYSQPGGDVLVTNPLLLSMLVNVVDDRKDRELPAGRAGLYRRWIEKWYQREIRKANNARQPLPWSPDKVRSALAALALAGRQQGYRTIPIELAREELTKFASDADAFLYRISQGPLIMMEDDKIVFRNETFQEYLCAEALLSQPESLRSVTEEDYGTWGMPLAYAAELQYPLPDALWRAAWAMNPWMGVALTGTTKSAPLKKIKQEPLRSLCAFALGQADTINTSRQISSHKHWYTKDDIPLQYLLTARHDIGYRWQEFECLQLQHSWHPALAVSALGRMLICPATWPPNFREHLPVKTWITKATPKQAIAIVHAGLVAKELFGHRLATWIAKATSAQAAALVQAGWVAKEEFERRKAEWIAEATPQQAIAMVQAGWAVKDLFEQRKAKWIAEATPQQAIAMVQAGWAAKEEFERRRKTKWIAKATPKEAIALIQAGWVAKELFKHRYAKWITSAIPNKAIMWVRKGLIEKEQFEGQNTKWIAKATPKDAIALVQAGWIAKEEFESRTAEWIAKSNPKEAIALVQAGWIAKEEFESRTAEWITGERPRRVNALVHAGLISPQKIINI